MPAFLLCLVAVFVLLGWLLGVCWVERTWLPFTLVVAALLLLIGSMVYLAGPGPVLFTGR